MAKIIASGDWHVSKDTVHNLSILNFMDYLLNYMKQNEIRNFVFLGDLIHFSNKLEYNIFLPFFNKFLEWKNVYDINMVFILGNHDILNDNNDSLLELLSPLGRVVQKSDTIEIDGEDYDFLSYTENKNDLPKQSLILFSHLDIKDFYFNNIKSSENNFFSTPDLDMYHNVITGHFHKMQHRDNIYYVGSPVQTNFGEAGQIKYFAVINGLGVDLVKYEEGLKYKTLKLEDCFDKDLDFTNTVLKVEIDKNVDEFVKLKEVLYKRGVVDVQPVFTKSVIDTYQNKIQINKDEGIIKSTIKYLKSLESKEINNDLLLKKYKEVLKRLK